MEEATLPLLFKQTNMRLVSITCLLRAEHDDLDEGGEEQVRKYTDWCLEQK